MKKIITSILIMVCFINTTTTGSITIPTSSYPVGVYIVVVKTGTSLVTQQKLIIE